MSRKQAISFLKETYNKWSEHQAPRLGASVAFYSLLSFAPLLILITALIALVLGQESAQGALIGQARQMMGTHGADTVQNLLKNSQKPTAGIFSSVVAFITLLFGASGVFSELESALNIIWEAPEQTSSGLWGTIKQRLFSFGMVLSVGFLLLISLVLSTALSFMGHGLSQILPLPDALLQGLNFIVSIVVIAVVFALMFKYVPNVKVSWHYVIIGAIGTAILFTIGKFLLGLYIGKASVGSTYGAAGSLVAVIVWIYYSAQIFFFGAEFTHVYALAHGHARPETEKSKEPKAEESKDPKAEESKKPKPEPVAAKDHSTVPPKAVAPPPATIPVPSSVAVPAASSARVSVESEAHAESRLPELPGRDAAETPTVPIPGQSLSKLAMALGIGFLLGRAFAPSRDEGLGKARRVKAASIGG